MNTWDDWSDKEVNAAIVKLQGYRVCDQSNVSDNAWEHPSKVCYGTFPSSSDNSFIGWLDSKDYCNNPADIWPIILNNRLMITPDQTQDLWMVRSFHTVRVVCQNPLRAAAIAFLEMNGVKP